MFRKNEPLDFRIRPTCAAHLRHHCKYDSRSCRSEYLRYLIPRLYGGEVTTRSTLRFGSRDIPSMQSSGRRSNFVTKRKCCPSQRVVQVQKSALLTASGEHRLPACPFRQPAEKLFERSLRGILAARGSRRQAANGNRLAALCSPRATFARLDEFVYLFGNGG